MVNDIINGFVSHFHEDEDSIVRMQHLIGDRVMLKNGSVTTDKYNNAHNPDYIKTILRSRINWASTFICLIGPKTHNSEWVEYEIEAAHRMGKPIIGVYDFGATDADVPESLKKYANSIVGWRKDAILAAIEGTRSFENVDGSPWPYMAGNRTTC